MDLSHYVLNLVPSTMQPTDPFLPVSNPYLDGSDSTQSNCIVCHSFAMRPPANSAGSPHAHLCGAQAASTLTQAQLEDLTSKYASQQIAGCGIDKRASADMSWTLAQSKPACGDRVCVVDAPQVAPLTLKH